MCRRKSIPVLIIQFKNLSIKQMMNKECYVNWLYPGIINTYHGDIYNCTTNTDNVKTPDTSKWPCDNWEEQQPINSTFSGEGYNPEQFDLAQQQLQQINACHTNTTYTNADYSKVVVQLVSLINNIETISSTPLTQQTQSILNQIHNIRYEKKTKVLNVESLLSLILNPTRQS